MAFNLYAGFTKYKRVWMAAILLLCMITFVLCTGVSGDFSDIVLRAIGGRRGTVVASIDGANIYREDIEKLKKQRKVANSFMLSSARHMIDSINDRLKNTKEFEKTDEGKEALTRLQVARQVLTLKTKNTNFFGTGTKIDDLVDFRMWLAEADRLGVFLTPENVVGSIKEPGLIEMDLVKRLATIGMSREQIQQIDYQVFQEIRSNHGYDIDAQFIFKALENEYRARIAQLAASEYQLRTADGNVIKRVPPQSGVPAELVRAPMTPGQIWDTYKDQRAEFDVVLLPIPVSVFTKEIAAPDKRALEDLFEKHKKTVFDPAADSPGFRKPNQIKVQWASADPLSPHFRQIARVSNTMAAFPIGSFAPQMPMATAVRMLAGPAVTDFALDVNYNSLSRGRYETAGYLQSDLVGPIVAYFANKDPVAAALAVALSDSPMSIFGGVQAAYLTVGGKGKGDIIKESIPIEARRRVPQMTSLIISNAMPTGLNAAAQGYILSLIDARFPPRLPLPVVRDIVAKDQEDKQSIRWVRENMIFLKKRLEDDRVFGKSTQMQRELERFGPRKPGEKATGEYRDLGLEIGQTAQFHDRYNIHTAPELKKLKEAFERDYPKINLFEGRDLKPELKLSEGDFWKLFFDGTQSFSLAASGGKWQAKPWPPRVVPANAVELANLRGQSLGLPENVIEEMLQMSQNRDKSNQAISLFEFADRPFLFWKIDEMQSEIPDSLAEVEDKVVDGYKFLQAREKKALPLAEKLAVTLLSGNADYATVLRGEAAKIGQQVITLPRLAKLYSFEHFGQGPRIYKDYPLPKDMFSYPREDMVKQLLTLRDLQEPIKIGVTDIDNLNAALFKKATDSKLGPTRFVQVLTNKPRDTYFVAVIGFDVGHNPRDFFTRVVPGAVPGQGGFASADPFFDRAQEQLGKTHLQDLILQLRRDHRVKIEESARGIDADPGT